MVETDQLDLARPMLHTRWLPVGSNGRTDANASPGAFSRRPRHGVLNSCSRVTTTQQPSSPQRPLNLRLSMNTDPCANACPRSQAEAVATPGPDVPEGK